MSSPVGMGAISDSDFATIEKAIASDTAAAGLLKAERSSSKHLCVRVRRDTIDHFVSQEIAKVVASLQTTPEIKQKITLGMEVRNFIKPQLGPTKKV